MGVFDCELYALGPCGKFQPPGCYMATWTDKDEEPMNSADFQMKFINTNMENEIAHEIITHSTAHDGRHEKESDRYKEKIEQ